jgi:hypothetical protein
MRRKESIRKRYPLKRATGKSGQNHVICTQQRLISGNLTRRASRQILRNSNVLLRGVAMKKRVTLVNLLLGVCLSALFTAPLLLSQSQPAPQACSDEGAVVASVKQDLAALVDTVKKESQGDFDTKYHEQTCQSRLSICLDTTTTMLDCLDKASKDASTPKDQLESIKALQAAYTKLKSTLDQDIQALKGAKDTKSAKALIAEFDFSH